MTGTRCTFCPRRTGQAVSCPDRGATDLERAPGPVGASKLHALLDIPRDDREQTEERFEAEWAAAEDDEGRQG